jgi:hypothetical protein
MDWNPEPFWQWWDAMTEHHVVSANLLHGFGRVMLQISQTGPFAALNVYG